MGDLIAFLGSVFGAFNLQIVAPLLQVYKMGFYIVISNVFVLLLSVFSIVIAEEHFTFGFDPSTGLFGFLHPSYYINQFII